MDRSRYLLLICMAGLGVLVAASPVGTQEVRSASLPLSPPENPQALSLQGSLNHPESLTAPRQHCWFQQLSPLQLALLPEGAWIDPRCKLPISWLERQGDVQAWRPLSRDEITERKAKLTSKALEYSAELADSLRAPYVSQGIRWTKEALSSYRNTLANRYRVRLNISDDQAIFQYDLDY